VGEVKSRRPKVAGATSGRSWTLLMGFIIFFYFYSVNLMFYVIVRVVVLDVIQMADAIISKIKMFSISKEGSVVIN
jgi:hypothetical protein